jgi:hypothetical protein
MRAGRLGRLAGLILMLAAVVATGVGAFDGVTTLDFDWHSIIAGAGSGL